MTTDFRPTRRRRGWLYVLLLVCCNSLLHSQPYTDISGVVNDYARVLAIGFSPCCSQLTLDDASPFIIGRRVMIIQMNGADVDLTNGPDYGEVIDYRGSGNYEFATITAKAGNLLTLDGRLRRSYETQYVVQLVQIPNYTGDVRVVAPGLTAKAWDGSTGGILVLEFNHDLLLNADIDVSEKGFRGGAVSGDALSSCSAAAIVDYYAFNKSTGFGTSAAGFKGEGIAATTIAGELPGQELGRGALANSGGGGNHHNAGGGGGGHAGFGGFGGKVFSGCPGHNFLSEGGYNLPFSDAAPTGAPNEANRRLFMGGGGGGGHEGHFEPGHHATPGKNGGGIIFIKCLVVIGNGNAIRSNGGAYTSLQAERSLKDGAGGGGAGGLICLSCNDWSAQVPALSLEVKGGDGGHVDNAINATWQHGEGGGGGHGLVWTNWGGTVPGHVNLATSTGQPGSNHNPSGNHGATVGGIGSATLISSLTIPEIGPCCEGPTQISLEPGTPPLEGDNCCFNLNISAPSECNIDSLVVTFWPSLSSQTIGYSNPFTQQICVPPSGYNQEIWIDFINANGDVVCSDTLALDCPMDCCANISAPTLTVLPSNPPDLSCCVQLDQFILGSCPIFCVRVRDAGDPQTILKDICDYDINLESHNLGDSFCLETGGAGGSHQFIIEYITFDDEVLCSTTASVECPDVCCATLAPVITPIDPTPPNRDCCFDFSQVVDEGCDLATLEIVATAPAQILDPAVGQGGPLVLYAFDAGTNSFHGSFCLQTNGSGVTQLITFRFRNAANEVVCEVQETVYCACDCGGESYGPELIPQDDAPAGQCCWDIEIDASASACPLYGLEIEMDGAVVFTDHSFSGGPKLPGESRTVGEFCVDVFVTPADAPRSVDVRYFDESGAVQCFSTAELLCKCKCENDITLEARIEKAYSADPNDCCWDIYVENSELCPIAGEGIWLQYGTAQDDDPPIIGIQNGQWNGAFLPGYEQGDDNTIRWQSGAGDNCIPANGEIYLGRICVESDADPMNVNLSVITQLHPGGGATLCPFFDEIIDCDMEAADCCDDYDIQLTPGFGSPSGDCCGLISVERSPEADCDIYGIVLIGANGGGIPHDPSAPIAFPPGGGALAIDSYCVPAQTAGLIRVILLDINGNAVCERVFPIDCFDMPPYCCDSLDTWLELTSLPPNDCCGIIHVNQQPDPSCSIYGIVMRGNATGGIPYSHERINLPPYQTSFPVGNFCVPFPSSGSVIIDFLDVNGQVACTQEIPVGCGVPRQGLPGEVHLPAVKDDPAAARLLIAPNPANRQVLLTWELSEAESVTLELWTERGQKLRLLAEGAYRAGIHNLPVNTDALASGAYIVKLSYPSGLVTTSFVVRH